MVEIPVTVDAEGADVWTRRAVRAVDAPLEGILLQREVAGGVEALVGVTTAPTFGPVVVCGLGGVLVEVLGASGERLAAAAGSAGARATAEGRCPERCDTDLVVRIRGLDPLTAPAEVEGTLAIQATTADPDPLG